MEVEASRVVRFVGFSVPSGRSAIVRVLRTSTEVLKVHTGRPRGGLLTLRGTRESGVREMDGIGGGRRMRGACRAVSVVTSGLQID